MDLQSVGSSRLMLGVLVVVNVLPAIFCHDQEWSKLAPKIASPGRPKQRQHYFLTQLGADGCTNDRKRGRKTLLEWMFACSSKLFDTTEQTWFPFAALWKERSEPDRLCRLPDHLEQVN